jgi:hypothetical protein
VAGAELPPLAERLFAHEQRRTQALVGRDIATARALHAAEYQRVTPAGKAFDCETCLAAVPAGHYSRPLRRP